MPQPQSAAGTPAPPRRSGRTLGRAAMVAVASAAALSGMAAYVERRRRSEERRHPPIGRLLRIDDSVIHVVSAGEGLPVVMIHGAGSMVQDFTLSLMAPVARHWRAVAFDRPGYGYSSRPRAHDWTLRRQAAVLGRAMAMLDIERAIVVGHSLGTAVALALALDHPDRVAGLVLISGYYYPERRPELAPMLALAVPGLSSLATRTVAPLLGAPLLPRIRRHIFAPNPVPDAFRAGFPDGMMLRPSHLRATARDMWWLSRGVPDMMPLYHYVRQPVALLAGAADHVITTERQSARLARALPDASLTILPGVGHMLHHTAPKAVVAAIAEVAARHHS